MARATLRLALAAILVDRYAKGLPVDSKALLYGVGPEEDSEKPRWT